MIFVDGSSSRPPPGQPPAAHGRLGLIDFGMTKGLTTTERRYCSRSWRHDDDEEAMLEGARRAAQVEAHAPRHAHLRDQAGAAADGGGDEAEAVYKSDPTCSRATARA